MLIFQILLDRHGFDHYYGIPYSHGMCPCVKCFTSDTINGTSTCWNKCRKNNVGCPLFHDEKIVEQPTDFTLLSEKYTNKALEFMKSSVEEHKKPFFLYFGYHQTHHPQFASKNGSYHRSFHVSLYLTFNKTFAR